MTNSSSVPGEHVGVRPDARGAHNRVKFIDATRGLAMLLVMTSHFAQVFLSPDAWAYMAIGIVGHVATPTFVIISGTLVGFLYRTRPDNFENFRIKLTDRGIFLLTIGHALILAAHRVISPTGHWVFITDAVGFSVIVGPFLLVRMSTRARLLLALGLYATSWLAIVGWHPSVLFALTIKETFFGSFAPRIYSYAFQIVPWFSLDLASSALGEQLGARYLRGDLTAIARLLCTIALSAFATAVSVAATIKLFVTPRISSHTTLDLVYAVRALGQKSPPAPVYLLFYGACGLGLLSTVLWAERQRVASRVLTFAATVGQNSLFTFVLQYFIYYAVLHSIRAYLPFQGAWPVYFVATLAVILLTVLEWHRRGYTRHITVGYPYVVELVRRGAWRRLASTM